MGLLSSPPQSLTMYHQSNVLNRTASPSETQFGQPAAGPSRGSTYGQATGRPLASLENGHSTPQDSIRLENRLVNGDVEHVASSEPNGSSFKPQNISRARTENHQTLAHRPRAMLTRSKTNYEPEGVSSTRERSVEEHGELRHGWEDEYNSSEFLGQLNSVSHHIPARFTESARLMRSVGLLHVLHG